MKARKFARNPPSINYKKLYLIAVEGKTEKLYFEMFKIKDATFRIKIPNNLTKSSPLNLLEIIQKSIKNEPLRKGDEIWLVFDHDNRDETEFQNVYKTCQMKNYQLAMSYPKFEYWLLLHFDNGNGHPKAHEIDNRLKSYMPSFKKGNLDIEKLQAKVKEAVKRAKEKDNPPCVDWLRKHGSMVYRLVEKLI